MGEEVYQMDEREHEHENDMKQQRGKRERKRKGKKYSGVLACIVVEDSYTNVF